MKEISLTVKDVAKMKKALPHHPGSVDCISVVYALNYLKPGDRISFLNDAHRVLKKGGKLQVQSPHWACGRSYADLRMEYPPVSEAWFLNANADYRKQDATGDKRYKCDFDVTWGYSLHPTLQTRNQEYQQHAVTFFKEAAQDLAVTLIKR